MSNYYYCNPKLYSNNFFKILKICDYLLTNKKQISIILFESILKMILTNL